VLRVEVAERGHKHSRLRKFASTVAFRGTVVDRHLAGDFEGYLAMRGRSWRSRGAA
jgi:hypothetical protein